MHCFESLAIRMKVYSDLREVCPDLEYDELELDELIQDFTINSFAEFIAMSNNEQDILINEGLARMSIPTYKAA